MTARTATIQEEDTAGAGRPPNLAAILEEAPATIPRLPRRPRPQSALVQEEAVQEEAIPGSLPPPNLAAMAEEDVGEEEVFATPADALGGGPPPSHPTRHSGRVVAPASLPTTQMGPAPSPPPAPRKAVSPAGLAIKTPSPTPKAPKRKRASRRDRTDDYGRAIHAVFSQLGHTGATSISKSAMAILNDLLVDVRDKLAGQAGTLVRQGKGQTLGAQDVQTAVRLAFHGELAVHAVNAGTKAVVRSGVPRGGV